MLCEKGGGGCLNTFAKSIHLCQPALSTMGRNFSIALTVLHVKESFYIKNQSVSIDEHDESPPRLAQWCACRTHDLVVVSSIAG